MRKIPLALVALLSSTIVAGAGQTTYAPHPASAVPVAERSDGEQCPRREVLACIVQLGPNGENRWSYLLADRNGEPNAEVKYNAPASVGAPCAGMAYPTGNVKVVGGPGDWFPGRIRNACRE
jgi:hypothetical protein